MDELIHKKAHPYTKSDCLLFFLVHFGCFPNHECFPVISCHKSAGCPCKEKYEEKEISLIGIDQRLFGLSAMPFRVFFNYRLINAGPFPLGGEGKRRKAEGEEQYDSADENTFLDLKS